MKVTKAVWIGIAGWVLATAPCFAESLASSASSAGSSASSAGSASSGSLSDSLNQSSKSSTGTTKTADGDYRVIDVAEPAARPGMLLLTLRGAVPEQEFTLTLPGQALAPRGIAAGDVVRVRNRDFGLEFARADGSGAREPFFLVLHDDWQRELAAHPVSL